MNEKEVLTLREAAEFFKIHPNTLRLWLRQGKIKGSKIGRKWVFLKDDLISIIKDYQITN